MAQRRLNPETGKWEEYNPETSKWGYSPAPIDARVGPSKDIGQLGYHSAAWSTDGKTILSAIGPSGTRVDFKNGAPPVAATVTQSSQPASTGTTRAVGTTPNPPGQRPYSASGTSGTRPAARTSGLLNAQHDGSGNLLGGIDPQTGEKVQVVNGQLQNDGKPNPALLHQLKQAQAQPAASTSTPPRIATGAPTIPTQRIAGTAEDAHSAMVDVSKAGGFSFPSVPPVAAPAAVLPAQNAGGYLTHDGTESAVAHAYDVAHPHRDTSGFYGKITPTIPVMNAPTPGVVGTTAYANGGYATVGIADQNAPADGGPGITRNGIPMTTDAKGNFVPAVAGPPEIPKTAHDVPAAAGVVAPAVATAVAPASQSSYPKPLELPPASLSGTNALAASGLYGQTAREVSAAPTIPTMPAVTPKPLDARSPAVDDDLARVASRTAFDNATASGRQPYTGAADADPGLSSVPSVEEMEKNLHMDASAPPQVPKISLQGTAVANRDPLTPATTIPTTAQQTSDFLKPAAPGAFDLNKPAGLSLNTGTSSPATPSAFPKPLDAETSLNTASSASYGSTGSTAPTPPKVPDLVTGDDEDEEEKKRRAGAAGALAGASSRPRTWPDGTPMAV